MRHFKCVIYILCIILSSNSFSSPEFNQIKYWIGNETIIVEKGSGFFSWDKSEKIDIGKIDNLKITKRDDSLNKGYSITSMIVGFDYLYKNKKIKCTSNITYSWLTAKATVGENTLETLILNCD